MKIEKRITAADVIASLRGWFPSGQYAFLEQVAPGTGARGYRWADAVAMSVWPSRGYDIHGIEVKVSRYDWLKELKQPTKSEAIQKYCNRWWIATPDESLIQLGELPLTWGHMVMKGDTMRVVIQAPPLDPQPITIEFLAGVLRNVQRADNSSFERVVRAEVEKRVKQRSEHYRDQYNSLKKECDAFEAASGIRINQYSSGKELGESVRAVESLSWKVNQIAKAVSACDELKGMLAQVQALAALKEAVA